MDRISKARRSRNMAAIKAANTSPELTVRKAFFKAGLRYRLHDRQLPGCPDVVFASRKLVVFVHGCFWHGCTKCRAGRRKVKSNTDYWIKKVRGNRLRDRRNRSQLIAAGWQVEEIWDCELAENKSLERLIKRIARQKLTRAVR